MGKYNLQPYNLNENVRYMWFERLLPDVVECVAGTKRMIYYQMGIGDLVRANIRLTIMVYKKAEYGDVVKGLSKTLVEIPMVRLLSDAVRQKAYIAKNLSFSGDLADHALADVRLGKVIFYSARLADAINKEARAGKVMWFSRADYNAILCVVNAYTIVVVTGMFHGTIRDGQTLVINSGNYTAALDGVNVINQYNGDWIFITPELIDVKVSTSGGLPMQGTIEYVERYI